MTKEEAYQITSKGRNAVKWYKGWDLFEVERAVLGYLKKRVTPATLAEIFRSTYHFYESTVKGAVRKLVVNGYLRKVK